MTSVRLAAYIGGGALLVAWFAAAAGAPVSEVASRDRAQPAPTSGSSSIASEVEAQATQLRARLSQAPTPSTRQRNPFSFAPRRSVRAASVPAKASAAVDPAAPAVPVVPTLLLMGIAEDSSPDGPRRTAVIGGAADALYMVMIGQRIADRYEVTAIGADAVELKDLLTGGYRRLALR
jgi:hypothetical protein